MCPAATQHRRMRGYLLAEALLALLITAGTLAALITLQVDLQRQARLAAERGEAARWAEHSGEDWLGRIRAGTDPAGADADHAGELFQPMTDITDPALAPPGYWKQWSISPHPPISTIEIVVEWPQPNDDPLLRLHWRSAAATASAVESVRASATTMLPISP